MSAVATACTGECAKSGPWGLLVVLLLCVACYFLFKSMSRHLTRVREDFPIPGPAGPVRPPTPNAASGLTPRRLNPAQPRRADPGPPQHVEPTPPRIIDGDPDGGPHAPR